jgi:hypothetical protein
VGRIVYLSFSIVFLLWENFLSEACNHTQNDVMVTGHSKVFIMERKNEGFTLIELLIAVIAIMVVGGIFLRPLLGNQENTEAQAKAWASKLFGGEAQATCTRFDTDGDGYISCDVAVKSPSGTSVYPVLCAAPLTFNTGCKLKPVITPGRTFQ